MTLQETQEIPAFDAVASILHRDAMMLVLNKPAGLPVHAGPKGGPNLGHYLEALRFGLPKTPELAHRLDKDTSGCLVLGRHRQALKRLGELFAGGGVEKTYWAVVRGVPELEEGAITFPLAKRSPDSRSWWMMVDEANGLHSETRYKVLGQHAGLTWLELKPITGRTHQLRVHCAAMGWPILGDAIYHAPNEPKPDRAGVPPLHLHARAVSIPIHPKKPPVVVEAPVPGHMVAALEGCGYAIP